MKNRIIIIGLICLSLVGCSPKAPNTYTYDNFPIDEWVSPDGVHYWIYYGLGGAFGMAPRIDKNGNYVID